MIFDSEYTFADPLMGGILIGLASLLATAATGKIPGISGAIGRLLVPATPDKRWRAAFLAGLIAGAAAAIWFSETAAIYRPLRSLPAMAAAGLLVGFGTRLGGGCTSGHGVCGVGLGSRDSIAATVIFVAAGMATVYGIDHLGGGRLLE